MRTRFRTGVTMAGLTLLLGACANLFDDPIRPDPLVRLIATVNQCGFSEPGIHGVNAPDADFSPELRDRIAESSLPDSREPLVVSFGRQPTPGYSLGMFQSSWYGDATLNINMRVEEPADEAVVAQVITTTCAILEVPAEGWNQVRVEANLEGFPVAWVRRDD